ncbi:MAG: Gfo/Idh/MocA family oxidoreductase [Lentisphaeria bacterium]|nr:Gfo/Idh/MocA family oxidoreductase [Lentisphaeria bacterium]
MKTTKVGIIGCGMISDAYFKASSKFNILEVVACSDIIPERSAKKNEMYGVPNVTNEELLANKDIEIVINLTPPQVHSKIAMDALNAGKHTHSEKPFGVDAADAAKVMALSKEKNLRVGCAPDTFLGSGQQTARKMLDDGWIGKPLSGVAMVMGRGPEKWPHAPFFYDYGAGPMLDLGPYYITALVNMLGPAVAVTAVTKKGFDTRRIGPEVAPQYQHMVEPYGEYPVNVTTHLTGLIEFANGALITVLTSFDIITNAKTKDYYNFQIHGTEGTMLVPDPNGFGGDVQIFRKGYDNWVTAPKSHCYSENSRSIGAADMAYALRSGRKHRCSGDLANHVLDIMLAFDRSSKAGARVELTTTCERPAPLPMGLMEGELDA